MPTHYKHDPEQVRECVAEAMRIVDELRVPPALRVPAFTEAVRLLAGRVIVLPGEGTPPGGGNVHAAGMLGPLGLRH